MVLLFLHSTPCPYSSHPCPCFSFLEWEADNFQIPKSWGSEPYCRPSTWWASQTLAPLECALPPVFSNLMNGAPSHEPWTCDLSFLFMPFCPVCWSFRWRCLWIWLVSFLTPSFINNTHLSLWKTLSILCTQPCWNCQTLSLDLGSWEKWYKVWKWLTGTYSNSALKRLPSIRFCISTCYFCPDFSCSWG